MVRSPLSNEEKTALGAVRVQRGGPDTLHDYLNEKAYWKNVPRRVWEYYLGGYQVLKKWLSYPERPILGRGLTVDEVAHVRDTARRIAALLLLGSALYASGPPSAQSAAPLGLRNGAWPRPQGSRRWATICRPIRGENPR
jgi:Type ISP C-terminal specificity domain